MSTFLNNVWSVVKKIFTSILHFIPVVIYFFVRHFRANGGQQNKQRDTDRKSVSDYKRRYEDIKSRIR